MNLSASTSAPAKSRHRISKHPQPKSPLSDTLSMLVGGFYIYKLKIKQSTDSEQQDTDNLLQLEQKCLYFTLLGKTFCGQKQQKRERRYNMKAKCMSCLVVTLVLLFVLAGSAFGAEQEIKLLSPNDGELVITVPETAVLMRKSLQPLPPCWPHTVRREPVFRLCAEIILQNMSVLQRLSCRLLPACCWNSRSFNLWAQHVTDVLANKK